MKLLIKLWLKIKHNKKNLYVAFIHHIKTFLQKFIHTFHPRVGTAC